MPNMIKSNHVNDFMNDRDLNHINYSGIHQTNGYTNKSNNSTGRYTILSKSTTIRNGTNKGSYHPASHYFQLDTTKRSHSQQSIGSNISNGSINVSDNKDLYSCNCNLFQY
ncbi:unnamed protein product [Schistosoma margrebowiei]|uniref:Uncharacterized protein n=1 Tax=Schistosoma margrebowiei TaxID=48269 RepID=A0A183LP42_9TREM|nr:unnamed protein product [Schistosoma margrebowiei]